MVAKSMRCCTSHGMADSAQLSDDPDATKAAAAPPAEGLVFCGSTTWETIGGKQANDGSTSLPAPTRPLANISARMTRSPDWVAALSSVGSLFPSIPQ
jgi:hypothetical protein